MANLQAHFEQWQKQPPPGLVSDPLWRMTSNQGLGTEEAEQRQLLLTQVIKILTVAIPRERSGGSERRIRRARKGRRDELASDGES